MLIPTRCDNCIFSTWIIGQCRPVLACRRRDGFRGKWRALFLTDSCSHFSPAENIKLNLPRRIPLTRGKFALVDSADYYHLAKFQWFAEFGGRTFYAVRKGRGKRVIMHREIMEAPGHLFVDHIDHNGLNNCRANLRLCSMAQNNYNTVSRKGATSKYKGVSWNRARKKWYVSIQHNGKKRYLGYFTDETEAAKAYDKKAGKLHRQFACLNFPPKK
jgi:hypothetical protein